MEDKEQFASGSGISVKGIYTLVEWLTNEIERRSWDYMQKIEDMGE